MKPRRSQRPLRFNGFSQLHLSQYYINAHVG